MFLGDSAIPCPLRRQAHPFWPASGTPILRVRRDDHQGGCALSYYGAYARCADRWYRRVL